MNKISEIERKVDLLVSGIVLPKKRTRRRVTAVVASVLIAMTLIASASIMTYYYQQKATGIDVKSAITITPSGGTPQETPWQEGVTLSGTIQAGGDYYTYPEVGYYTITNNANTGTTAYFDIEVTETLYSDPPVDPPVLGDGEGLLVEVWDVTETEPVTLMTEGTDWDGQILLLAGQSVKFEIRITADPLIDASSTYGYSIEMYPNSG